MIAPHILALCVFLSIMWGVYLAHEVWDYRQIRSENRAMLTVSRRGLLVAGFRRMLVAVCVFSLPFSFVFRTGMVLAGLGDQAAGQLAFFALVAPNVIGSIFAVLSLRFDD